MTEEIISALAAIASLRVASRTSVASRSRERTRTSARSARSSASASVLEGSVRQAGRGSGSRPSSSTWSSGYHLWSERYDREMEDVFAVQDEIARVDRRRP